MEKTNIDTYFNDIVSAMKRKSSDYFVGTIVLMWSNNKDWVILDGQQRLVTTSLLFASIRNWLASKGFASDANQIETDFILARMLGKEKQPRLTLNLANEDEYNQTIVNTYDIEVISEKNQGSIKRILRLFTF